MSAGPSKINANNHSSQLQTAQQKVNEDFMIKDMENGHNGSFSATNEKAHNRTFSAANEKVISDDSIPKRKENGLRINEGMKKNGNGNGVYKATSNFQDGKKNSNSQENGELKARSSHVLSRVEGTLSVNLDVQGFQSTKSASGARKKRETIFK